MQGLELQTTASIKQCEIKLDNLRNSLNEAKDRHVLLQEKVNRPDTKMDIFWGQMDRLTTKVDESIAAQNTEIH